MSLSLSQCWGWVRGASRLCELQQVPQQLLPRLPRNLRRQLFHQLLLRVRHLYLPWLHGQVAEQGDRGCGGSGGETTYIYGGGHFLKILQIYFTKIC